TESPPSKLSLVVLAAGISRRFGSAKQLEPVGPGGATILEYSIFDALRAGFCNVVLVIRPEMEAEIHERVGVNVSRHADLKYAHQFLEALPAGYVVPPGRTKPWGTGHAVLAAAECVTGPFGVVNADDIYGAAAFTLLAEF